MAHSMAGVGENSVEESLVSCILLLGGALSNACLVKVVVHISALIVHLSLCHLWRGLLTCLAVTEREVSHSWISFCFPPFEALLFRHVIHRIFTSLIN
jgi:hypothetical protein